MTHKPEVYSATPLFFTVVILQKFRRIHTNKKTKEHMTETAKLAAYALHSLVKRTGGDEFMRENYGPGAFNVCFDGEKDAIAFAENPEFTDSILFNSEENCKYMGDLALGAIGSRNFPVVVIDIYGKNVRCTLRGADPSEGICEHVDFVALPLQNVQNLPVPPTQQELESVETQLCAAICASKDSSGTLVPHGTKKCMYFRARDKSICLVNEEEFVSFYDSLNQNESASSAPSLQKLQQAWTDLDGSTCVLVWARHEQNELESVWSVPRSKISDTHAVSSSV